MWDSHHFRRQCAFQNHIGVGVDQANILLADQLCDSANPTGQARQKRIPWSRWLYPTIVHGFDYVFDGCLFERNAKSAVARQPNNGVIASAIEISKTSEEIVFATGNVCTASNDENFCRVHGETRSRNEVRAAAFFLSFQVNFLLESD